MNGKNEHLISYLLSLQEYLNINSKITMKPYFRIIVHPVSEDMRLTIRGKAPAYGRTAQLAIQVSITGSGEISNRYYGFLLNVQVLS